MLKFLPETNGHIKHGESMKIKLTRGQNVYDGDVVGYSLSTLEQLPEINEHDLAYTVGRPSWPNALHVVYPIQLYRLP
jgi:hypothetical protein